MGFQYPWLPREDVPEDAELVSDEVRHGRVQVKEPAPCWRCHGEKVVRDQWYHARNYDVFAILASVRNGVGFAGVITGSGFNPIDNPRGLPDDLSDEIRTHLARLGETVVAGAIHYEDERDDDYYEGMSQEPEGYWSLGDHSFSHVSLKELLQDYDWKQTTMHAGWVPPSEYLRWRDKGIPNSWAGDVGGQDLQKISAEEMERLIDTGEIIFEEGTDLFEGKPYKLKSGEKTRYFAAVSWTQTYREAAGEHFFEAMQRLAEMAPEGDLSRVRLVFGFDS